MRVKRVHEAPDPSDGRRILVDRLWPRGVTKERAAADRWMKEVAPSHELRREAHAGGRWEDFRRRYFAELDANPDAVAELRAELEQGPATLLYASRDSEHNHARALLEYLGR